MADDPKDDKNMGGGDPNVSTVTPSPKKVGEEPGAQNNFGGGQQPKATKKQNFKGGDPKQDTHK